MAYWVLAVYMHVLYMHMGRLVLVVNPVCVHVLCFHAGQIKNDLVW